MAGYFANPSHDEALARLAYLVEHRHSCGLLTGPAGSGKSFLWHVFLNVLRGQGQRGLSCVNLQGLSERDIAAHVAAAWNLGPIVADRSYNLWYDIQDQLCGTCLCRTHSVLILDHLDRAGNDAQLAVERLVRLARQAEGYLTILFAARSAGACSAAAVVSEMSDLRIELRPFDALETSRYISHRLQLAGFTQVDFEPEALMAIYQRTGGIPRQINRLCELLVVTAMAGSSGAISAERVHEVFAELPGHRELATSAR